VKALRSISAGNLVVTAKGVGAYGNAITCSWVASTKTLTVVADGVTETYTGATAALLIAAASTSPSVVVTSDGTLPVADAASAALATGTDDAANAVPATILGLLTKDMGTGLIAWAGKDYAAIGATLATHAMVNERLALLTCAAGADTSAATTAIQAVAAYTDAPNAVLAWPSVTNIAGTTMPPIGFAAACRARAHVTSPGTPPWGASNGRSRTGLVPDVVVTDAQFTALDALRLSVIQSIYAVTTLNGWHTAAPMPGNLALDEASQRDALNAIGHEALLETTAFTGRLSTRGELAAWAGVLSPPDPTLVPAGVIPDPGYLVNTGPSVNSPADLASGRVKALIQLRFSGSIEFASLTVSATDASARTF
jgi:hypothetical protein